MSEEARIALRILTVALAVLDFVLIAAIIIGLIHAWQRERKAARPVPKIRSGT